jgi:Zn-dependent M28 family amino/carboxypeptidase
MIGAHYDTRARADQSPGAEATPVIGAVDGGSGVAVLIELAHALDLSTIDHEIRLAFFDVEDNGGNGIDGWDWIAGSRYSADNLKTLPQAMILVDMVGQIDQEFYLEGNSDVELQAEIWAIAADLGYASSFIPSLKYTMIDDHVPFAQRGIRAIDIIDFDYPYWHTTEDTVDKMSAESLAEVGRVIEYWLER